MTKRRPRPTDGPDDEPSKAAVCDNCIRKNVSLTFIATAVVRTGAALAVSKELRKMLLNIGAVEGDAGAAEAAMDAIYMAQKRQVVE